MTQEQKDLLLKDLCARLPYDVKVQVIEVSDYTNEYLSPKIKTLDYLLLGKLGAVIKGYRKDEIKPYLFPLSSMTEEQQSYLHFNTKFRLDICNDFTVKIDEDDNYFYTDTSDYTTLIDWCNKNHFDYRGLIEKGLAIDATGLNIY